MRLKSTVFMIVLLCLLAYALDLQNVRESSSGLRIVYDHDVNESFIDSVFTNISNKELNGLNQIYFSSIIDENASGRYVWTHKSTSRNSPNIRTLVSTKIIIYNDTYRSKEYLSCTLWHELGHHHQMITERLNNLSEAYADDYAYAHGCAPGTIYDERLEQPRNLSYWE